MIKNKKILNSMIFIFIISTIYFILGFTKIEDGAVLSVLSILFGAGFGFLILSLDIRNRQKFIAKVILKERIYSELSGKSSRSFRYIFEKNNKEYEMPKDFRFGGIEYKIGDIVTLYLNKKTNTVFPKQILVIFSFLSIIFIALPIFLLLKEMFNF